MLITLFWAIYSYIQFILILIKKPLISKKYFNNLEVISAKRFVKAFTKDTPLCNTFITKAKTSV